MSRFVVYTIKRNTTHDFDLYNGSMSNANRTPILDFLFDGNSYVCPICYRLRDIRNICITLTLIFRIDQGQV